MGALSRDHSISICNCFMINQCLQCRMLQVNHLNVSLGILILKVFTHCLLLQITQASLICVTSCPIQLVLLLYVAEWTTEGCETDLAEVDEGVVTCNCNHLTNFAVLVVSIPSVCVCVCVCVCVWVCCGCVCGCVGGCGCGCGCAGSVNQCHP